MLLELPFAFFFSLWGPCVMHCFLCHAMFFVSCTALPSLLPSILANLPSLSSAFLNLQNLVQAQSQSGESNLWSSNDLQMLSFIHPWTTELLSLAALFRAAWNYSPTICLLLFVSKFNKQKACTVIFTILLLIASLTHGRLLMKLIKLMKKYIV